MTTIEASPDPVPVPVDEAARGAFGDRMLSMLNEALTGLLVSLGHQAGLFDTMNAIGPATSTGLASSATCDERYDNPGVLDWGLALLTLVVGLYPVLPIPLSSIGFGGYEGFLDRQGTLLTLDVLAGLALMVLVLEATRRTTGLV
ncbi:MAG: hypothetical protein WBQ50_20785, partial [Nocardioides sp.]